MARGQGSGVRGGLLGEVTLEGGLRGEEGQAVCAEEAANAKLLWWERTWG